MTPPASDNLAPADRRATLQAEARRRAETGEPLRVIAKALQVSETTMYRWAALGGFRQIDRRRKAAGQPALPVPKWTKPDKSKCQPASERPDRQSSPVCAAPPMRSPRTPASIPADAQPETLRTEAALLAREALALVRMGNIKQADEKMRASDRLLRIEKRLALLSASDGVETSGVQLARDRIKKMSDSELEAEIKRLAGIEV